MKIAINGNHIGNVENSVFKNVEATRQEVTYSPILIEGKLERVVNDSNFKKVVKGIYYGSAVIVAPHLMKQIYDVLAPILAPTKVFAETTVATLSPYVANAGTQTVGAIANHSIIKSMLPLIRIVQDFALPIGIVVGMWGLVEWTMLGNPSGKSKLKNALIGLAGVYILPFAFIQIGDVLGGVFNGINLK